MEINENKMKEKSLFETIAIDSDSPVYDFIEKIYGSNLASYFKSPIEDEKYIELIRQRAEKFEINNFSVPFYLIEDFTFDIGGTWINDSMTISTVDIEKSNDLAKFLSKKLSFNIKATNTHAAFINQNTLDLKKSHDESVVYNNWEGVVMTTQLDDTEIGFHILDKNGFRTLFFRNLKQLKKNHQNAREKLNKSIPHQSTRFTGFYNSILAYRNGKWYKKRYHELMRFPVVEYTRKFPYTSDYRVCTIEKEEIKEEADIEKQLVRNLIATHSNVDNVYSDNIGVVYGTVTPSASVGTIIGVSGIVDISTGEGENTYYGPPGGAGGAQCYGYESRDNCYNCCKNWLSGEQAVLLGLLLACLAAASCSPCGHAACGIAYGIGIGISIGIYDACMKNCKKTYTEPEEFQV